MKYEQHIPMQKRLQRSNSHFHEYNSFPSVYWLSFQFWKDRQIEGLNSILAKSKDSAKEVSNEKMIPLYRALLTYTSQGVKMKNNFQTFWPFRLICCLWEECKRMANTLLGQHLHNMTASVYELLRNCSKLIGIQSFTFAYTQLLNKHNINQGILNGDIRP